MNDEWEKVRPVDQRKTLRDAFAMAALQGILSDLKTIEAFDSEAGAREMKRPKLVAMSCYAYADAMLAAREANNT